MLSVKISHHKGRIQIEDTGFEVLTAVVMKSSAFWNKMSYSLLIFNRLHGVISQKTEPCKSGMFQKRALMRIFGPRRGREKKEAGGTYVMRSIKFCNLEILMLCFSVVLCVEYFIQSQFHNIGIILG
jgi:hypothetical protein